MFILVKEIEMSGEALKGPLQLFPKEIWELIFGQMELHAVKKCLKALPELNEKTIYKRNWCWLLDQVLPFLFELLSDKEILTLRKISKQWQLRVDFALQNQPVLYQAYSHELHGDNADFWKCLNPLGSDDLEGGITLFGEKEAVPSTSLINKIMKHHPNTRNPFVFRSLTLYLKVEVNERAVTLNHKLLDMVDVFLNQFGIYLWHLKIITPALLPPCEHLFSNLLYAPVIMLLRRIPKLKSLTLDINNGVEDEVDEEVVANADNLQPSDNAREEDVDALNGPENAQVELARDSKEHNQDGFGKPGKDKKEDDSDVPDNTKIAEEGVPIASPTVDELLETIKSGEEELAEFAIKIEEYGFPRLRFLESFTVTDNPGLFTERLQDIFLKLFGPQLKKVSMPLSYWKLEEHLNIFLNLTELIIADRHNSIDCVKLDQLLSSLSTPNLARLDITVYNSDIDFTFSIENNVLKWLKRFPRIKLFCFLYHNSNKHKIVLEEEGTANPELDRVPTLQTLQLVDEPGFNYNFLRCFPALRNLHMQYRFHPVVVDFSMTSEYLQLREPIQTGKVYESNIWEQLNELRRVIMVPDEDFFGEESDAYDDYEFSRETYKRLKKSGGIPPELQLHSFREDIQDFLNGFFVEVDESDEDEGSGEGSSDESADDGEVEDQQAVN